MSDTNLAWCAGFFDGEGHVSYTRSYPNKNGTISRGIRCSVSQSSENIETLEFFQTVVGLGDIRGPYPMPNGKPQHRLIFGIKEVSRLFALLEPYLKSKKTADFRRAIRGYEMHDPESTEEDFERLLRKHDKKRRRI